MHAFPARRSLASRPSERDKGFTLVELLVVVIIVGILAGIAVPVFLNQRKKAADAELKADMRNVAMAVEELVADRDDLTHNLMLMGGARFENGWNAIPGRVDWIQWGSPSLEGNLGLRINRGTYLYGKWTRRAGVHEGGLCMVAATDGGTHDREDSAPNFWSGRAADGGQFYWDSLDGGFSKHPSTRCLAVFNGAY